MYNVFVVYLIGFLSFLLNFLLFFLFLQLVCNWVVGKKNKIFYEIKFIFYVDYFIYLLVLSYEEMQNFVNSIFFIILRKEFMFLMYE